ncbi:MAG: phospholipase D family protein, partial [Sphingomonadaceae bacterium]
LMLAWAALRLRCRLPPPDPRPKLPPPPPFERTALWQRFQPALADHPQQSGVRALPDPVEALAARIRLIRAAQSSILAQYYIWRGDISGAVLLHELLEAARRGVQVRLLLDDNGIDRLDGALKALDSHPDVEVRLFNPFVLRWPKRIGYLVDFARLNRRMHNKALVVDGTLAVVGGRNIGDEYFGATDGALFADLDAVVAGPVVSDLVADFDRYWNCPSAHAVRRILSRTRAWPGQRIGSRAEAARQRPAAARYARCFDAAPDPDPLLHPAGYEWVAARLVSDDPAKGLGRAERADHLADQLLAATGQAERELGIVSAYFVPTREGVTELARLAARGVAVSILTNAYEANNHVAVHAGYAPRRRALLEAGVRLLEVRREASAPFQPDPESFVLEDRPRRRRRRPGSLRSSGSALHAKTFAVDRARIFIGSFNFDPRSLALNTELGVLLESPRLAASLMAQFDRDFAGAAWRVELAGGRLRWVDPATGAIRTTEPGTSPASRLLVRFLGLLPIEWLL